MIQDAKNGNALRSKHIQKIAHRITRRLPLNFAPVSLCPKSTGFSTLLKGSPIRQQEFSFEIEPSTPRNDQEELGCSQRD
jgi:hypothetical protein